MLPVGEDGERRHDPPACSIAWLDARRERDCLDITKVRLDWIAQRAEKPAPPFLTAEDCALVRGNLREADRAPTVKEPFFGVPRRLEQRRRR